MIIGIIGGTGVYDAEMLADIEEQSVLTKYGETRLIIGEAKGHRVAFLNRHGAGHKLPPHLINYRANIDALKQIGVELVVATAAVGSLTKDIVPGDLVVMDQFIDFTYARKQTFFHGGGNDVMHVDMTEPYCAQTRNLIIKAAQQEQLPIVNQGTYVCTQGPRFETPAEVAMFAQLGGDVVGMTSVPEVVLAREAQLCYAAVSVVTNFAAGISQNPLTHQEVLEVMAANKGNLKRLLFTVLELAENNPQCHCRSAVSGQNNLTGGS